MAGSAGESPPRRALAAAAGPWRPVESRLTGGFAYAPLPSPGSASGPADPIALTLAAARIASRAAEKPALTSLADFGVLYLLQGQPDQAVSTLEKALASATMDDAALLSDLGAAYLARAGARESAHGLLQALDTLERALWATPSLPEALFNRALALEKLGLRSAAAQAWTAYLALDPESGWADEARRRREGLAARPEPELWAEQRPRLETAVARGDEGAVEVVVRSGPGLARRDALELSLPGWAKATRDHRPREAIASLARARAIGQALARVRGDEFVRDLAAEIGQAGPATPSSPRLAALVSGHLALDEGRSLLLESRLEAGVAKLQEAETTLAAARSPLALRARCLLAKGAYLQARFEDGLRVAEAARASAVQTRYPALRAESARWVGLLRSVLGRPAEAVEAYRAALTDLEAAGNRDDVAAVKSLLAENLAVLGADEDAWALRVEALRVAESFQGAGATFNIFFEAADAAVAAGHARAALPLLDAAVRAAEESGNQVAVFETLIERSAARDRVGREGDAVADRARARSVVASLSDGSLKSRLQTENLLVEGELQAAREPSVAIGLLSRAESSLEEIGRVYHLPRLYRVLARAYREAGQIRESETYLRRAIEAGEAQASWAPTAASARRDLQREALADMVRLQFVALGNPAGALDYAERVRSWRLRGLLASARGRATLERRREDSASSCAVPAGDAPGQWARIEYFVLDDRILAWLVTPTGLSSAQALVAEATVRGLVGDLLGAAEQGRGRDLDAMLERAYELLMRPLRHLIPDQTPLLFVPDSTLEAVPFAALRDRSSGRYLIEDHEIAVTSSVDCAAERERPVRTSRRSSGTLVVGDPGFDGRVFPWLVPLPGAAREARAVSVLDLQSRLLLGEQATKDRFFREAAGLDVVHFAGHVLGNQDRPELSMLVLAPDRGRNAHSGAVYASEIATRDLNGLELVVLSACGTGLGANHGPVGLGGLAWSFLAAGARQVVTAIWRIEDGPTSDFMIDFHGRLRTEANATTALRQVQLEWIRHPDRIRRSPALWGGFTAMVPQGGRLPALAVASKQP